MDERAITQAYATYDSDPRAGGPDDRDAFVDAVTPLMPDRAVVEERWKQASKNYYFQPTPENRKAMDAAERAYRARPETRNEAKLLKAIETLEARCFAMRIAIRAKHLAVMAAALNSLEDATADVEALGQRWWEQHNA